MFKIQFKHNQVFRRCTNFISQNNGIIIIVKEFNLAGLQSTTVTILFSLEFQFNTLFGSDLDLNKSLVRLAAIDHRSNCCFSFASVKVLFSKPTF